MILSYLRLSSLQYLRRCTREKSRWSDARGKACWLTPQLTRAKGPPWITLNPCSAIPLHQVRDDRLRTNLSRRRLFRRSPWQPRSASDASSGVEPLPAAAAGYSRMLPPRVAPRRHVAESTSGTAPPPQWSRTSKDHDVSESSSSCCRAISPTARAHPDPSRSPRNRDTQFAHRASRHRSCAAKVPFPCKQQPHRRSCACER